MSSPQIGILGYGGAVGKVACSLLQNRSTIRGGQRSLLGKGEKKTFETMSVDIYEKESLRRFCKGCDTILNCAGPSYLMGDIVAQAAQEEGAAYVDVFGEHILHRKKTSDIKFTNNVFVFGAGVFPGLSAILPLWLISNEMRTINTVTGYAGGLEHCSWGAGADLLLSSTGEFGIPNCFWRDGKIVKTLETKEGKQRLPGFKDEVHVQPFINNEFASFATQQDLHEAYWHAVFADTAVLDSISDGCTRLVEHGANELNECVVGILSTASMAMTGRSPWYAMVGEISGESKGDPFKKRAILKTRSSYELSGIVAAEVALAVSENVFDEGVYWGFEIIDPSIIIESIRKYFGIDSLVVVDIDVNNELVNNKDIEMEMGML